MRRAALAVLLTFWAAIAAAGINVSLAATGGSGTAASPWTGWDTAITWSAETQYDFPSGVYAYSSSPNFLKTGIALKGEAGAVLKFTGSGNAVVFDNPGGGSPAYLNWTQNVRFENFIIQGNANATNGLFLRGVRNGIFSHVSVRDVGNACLWAEALVTNVFQNFRCTHHEMPNDAFAVRPAYGIVLAARGADTTTTSAFINPVVEGVATIGIWVKSGSYANRFIGGTSEGNLGKGAQLDGHLNAFDGTDFEANGGTDIEINHASNEVRGVYSGGLVDVKAGQMNRLHGRFQAVQIANSVDFTYIAGAYIATLTDSAGDTIKFGYQTVAGSLVNQTFIGNVMSPMPQISVVAGHVATDAKKSSAFWFAIYGDVTLDNPTNGIEGQAVTWRVQQDMTGGHALAFGDKFETVNGGLLPVISQASGAYTYLTARYNAQRGKWQLVSP